MKERGVSGERERSECAMREKRVSGKSVGRERGVSRGEGSECAVGENRVS